MGHALLAPSSADVWTKCPGSVMLRSMTATTNTPESEEGRAAHWVAEQILQDAVENEAVSSASWGHFVGNASPDGTMITKEMIEGAVFYANYVHSLGVEFPQYNIERTVTCFSIHQECWGTPDFFGIRHTEDGVELHVVDFKFGHRDVPAFENKQLLCYYVGILDELGIGDQDLTVTFHIVQPRCFHGEGQLKTWTFRGSDVRGLVNSISAAAHKALGAAEVVSGNQCRYCPARHSCEASRRTAAEAISYADEANPHPITDEALSYELPVLVNAIRALQYRKEALEEEAEARMRAGKSLQNISMKPRFGQRDWNADPEEIQILAEMSGVSFLKDPELVTPAEAERRLKHVGLSAADATAAIEGLIVKPNRGMKISITSSEDARKAFSQ